MALARVKTWNAGDTLTAADQNAEFNNILNNPITLISPSTAAINFQTSVAHTNLAPSAITASSGGGLPAALSIVRGLTGNVTSSQTITLSADAYLLQTSQNSSGGGFPTFFPLLSTASFTVNVGTAGPAVNGRDVAAVFNSTFIHVYAITTGAGSTTPAGIASSVAPPTGPVLPSSYNTWAYLGSFPYSTTSTTFAQPMRVRGTWMEYEPAVNVLSAGTATSETAVSLTGSVPAIAQRWTGHVQRVGLIADGSGLAIFTCDVRVISGTNLIRYNVNFGGGANTNHYEGGGGLLLPNVSQQFFYLFTITNGGTPQLTVDLTGYSIPNGGE